MKRARFPGDAERVSAWLEATREVAFSGQREDQCWREWWCLSELARRGGRGRVLPEAFEAEWLDGQSAPDFRIDGPECDGFFLEVTEATCEPDRQAIALARKLGGTHLIGRLVEGRRFREGAGADDYEAAMRDDILRAIERKRSKRYAQNAVLLAYPNSNAFAAEPRRLAELLDATGHDISPLNSVAVLSPLDTLLIRDGAGGTWRLVEAT